MLNALFSSVSVALASLAASMHQFPSSGSDRVLGADFLRAREESKSGEQRNFVSLIFDVAASGGRDNLEIGRYYIWLFDACHSAAVQVCLRIREWSVLC